ncbi:MAG: acyl-CoA dehydrogenase family protein [Candidatus Binatus sp.]|uniref:acyl-CoA dehydrogenase family protein n=1 Tax=Candidatus Binatus sp. TaxID=2811406 RepID=UPI00272196C6|nr:acyl-CoA dehydrogenase family protein [Candidatus Binatus sp.]MDO8432809.1 acyl-CoA dehydrogenase family protein [Candidatus Binatus sp.]
MTHDAKTVLASARDLAPTISARAAEIESNRRLPPDLLAQLTAAGLFRMFVPKSHGGLDLDYPTSMEIIEALATADGATGWVVMIGCETPMLLALMPPRRFDQLYADTPDVIIAGGFAPRGAAEPQSDRSYRVNGRWAFASGCQHSSWLLGNCVVTENGKPRPGLIPGTPEVRAMLFKAERATILDTWHVAGMRGTGSHDIAVKDIIVPPDDTFDIFLGRPTIPGPGLSEPLLYAAMHIGAVGVGIAERALSEMIKLAGTDKQRLYAQSSIAASPLFQYRLGHAATSLRAARGILRSEADAVWAIAVAERVATPADRSRVMGTVTWVAHTAASVVDACYTAGGGTSPYDASPLQRCLRDIHTLTQHAAVAESWLSGAGASVLGADSGFAL